MSRFKHLLSVALLLPALTHTAQAQEALTTASITGRVTDTTGAALNQANILAKQLATNQTSTTITDNQGRFRLPYLAVGYYTVTFSHAGFADTTTGLQLTVGSAFNLTIPLSITSATTAVEIAAQSPVIEQNRSQVAQTISETEATNLPYNGRNYLDLALLVPGVSATNTASVQTFAETSPIVGQGYSINSQRNFSNGFIVDGLSANDDAAGLTGNSYSLDVVREFQVVTSGGQAEFGRALGGYFNIVTRSGSNDLHGTAYGFLRNQRLNTNNALSASKLSLTQGQYGASLSGPIQRDRTFFFANFEQRHLNTDGIITITPANAASINTRLIAIGYKAPLLTVSSGPTTLYPTTVHTNNFFARADRQFSSADQFNLRYSFYKLDSINARGVGSLSAVSNGTAVQDTNHTVAASNIATLSPRTFNETRAQFTYDSLNAPSNDDIGPTVTISGVATLGRFSSSPISRLNYLYETVDNLVLERGPHTFKTGGDFLYNRDTITFPQTLRGAYTFSSLATFLIGSYNTQGYTQTFGTPTVTQTNPNIGFYLQDEWRIAPRLTLNAGLRYDLQFLRTLNTQSKNISPRIGFAWSPFGNAQTVIRGSFGLFYDRIPLRPLANALLSANNSNDVTQASLLSYTFTPGQPGAPTFPNTFSTVPTTGAVLNFTLMNRDIQNPYAEQASLEVEQQLTPKSSLGLSYQHLRGVHLITSVNQNINSDGTRPNPAYANSKAYDSKADSYYDGLALSFIQRPTKWSSARLSYTWSKAIDDVGEFFFSAPVNNFYPGEDRSRSDDDQRHRLVFNATLTSPTTRSHSFTDHLTHNWRLAGILQYTSRLPFNIVTGGTTKQGTTQRPCAPGFSLTASAGLNPCTEAVPGTLIGRNAGTGFDFFTLNPRLSRTFPLTERFHLEAIAESFNALNHRNDMIPNGTFGANPYPTTPNSTFGQATAVGDPRSIQLAARLTF